MGNLTTYGKNAALDYLMTGTRYVALHSADPTATGAVAEIGAGNGIARQPSTFSASSGGAASNNAALVFGPASAGYTPSHITIWDSLTGGNCIWQGPLSAATPVPLGRSYEIAVGDLDVAIS